MSGLVAKPVIDIDLIVSNSRREDSYVPPLAGLGYALIIREPSWYEHRMLRREVPAVNLHVFGRACPEQARHLLFRDWLRAHPADRDRYARAKGEAKVGATDVMAYNAAKQPVIREIYRRLFGDRGWIEA